MDSQPSGASRRLDPFPAKSPHGRYLGGYLARKRLSPGLDASQAT